jgi:glycerophosphoryl diester phosphodiesterase
MTTARWLAISLGVALLGPLVACGPRAPVVTGPLSRVHLPPRGVHVARSFGSIYGVADTSSVEAFLASYEKGFRTFSTDLTAMSDGTVVCIRPGTEAWLGLPRPVSTMSLTELLLTRLHGSFRPVTLPMLVELARRRPDTYFMVTPHGAEEVVLKLALACQEGGAELRNRIGVLGTSGEDVDLTREVEEGHGAFAFVGLQAIGETANVKTLPRSAARWQLPVVTLPTQLFTGQLATALHASSTLVLVGPVNDPKVATELLAAGADGILTDSLVR